MPFQNQQMQVKKQEFNLRQIWIFVSLLNFRFVPRGRNGLIFVCFILTDSHEIRSPWYYKPSFFCSHISHLLQWPLCGLWWKHVKSIGRRSYQWTVNPRPTIKDRQDQNIKSMGYQRNPKAEKCQCLVSYFLWILHVDWACLLIQTLCFLLQIIPIWALQSLFV